MKGRIAFLDYMLIGLWMRKFSAGIPWRKTIAAALPMWLVSEASYGMYLMHMFILPAAASASAAIALRRTRKIGKSIA